jgi:hypothetical protein
MPVAGGPTDKFGNCYEGYWTVNCMHLQPILLSMAPFELES